MATIKIQTSIVSEELAIELHNRIRDWLALEGVYYEMDTLQFGKVIRSSIHGKPDVDDVPS